MKVLFLSTMLIFNSNMYHEQEYSQVPIDIFFSKTVSQNLPVAYILRFDPFSSHINMHDILIQLYTI